MLNSRVELLFKNLPDKYPHVLAKDFPHVLNRLMQVWATPEFDPYMSDLMVDKRGGRKGFPAGAMEELIFMNKLHDAFKRNGSQLPKIEDPWKAIQAANPTPLGFMHAIEKGELEVVKSFLAAGVPVDYRFEGGQTPLIVAAINGRRIVARHFIGSGANLNARDKGQFSALHWAAFYNHGQLIDDLCKFDAQVNTVQNSGSTPLALAVTRGHVNAVKLLLNHKADPNIASNHGKPLAIAQSRGNQEMIALLKQSGAKE